MSELDPADIVTPLTYGDALALARRGLCCDAPEQLPQSIAIERTVEMLMAVDVASRSQWRSEAHDILTQVWEFLDDQADVIDGDEESGPRPNRAMQLMRDVDMLMGKVRE